MGRRAVSGLGSPWNGTVLCRLFAGGCQCTHCVRASCLARFYCKNYSGRWIFGHALRFVDTARAYNTSEEGSSRLAWSRRKCWGRPEAP